MAMVPIRFPRSFVILFVISGRLREQHECPTRLLNVTSSSGFVAMDFHEEEQINTQAFNRVVNQTVRKQNN